MKISMASSLVAEHTYGGGRLWPHGKPCSRGKVRQGEAGRLAGKKPGGPSFAAPVTIWLVEAEIDGAAGETLQGRGSGPEQNGDSGEAFPDGNPAWRR
ncbi:hypothetical protein ACUV84_042221 [Puccinellia chinampoensis]